MIAHKLNIFIPALSEHRGENDDESEQYGHHF
jgi:hypothetical protein